MCPNNDFSIIGDRVGDKLHETLVGGDEMAHTIDAGDRLIICPQEPNWQYSKPKGVPCGNRRAYQSDSNEWFLNIQEIKEKLEKIG
jgi:UDP-N-acetylglucosamine 4,6-dehydratase